MNETEHEEVPVLKRQPHTPRTDKRNRTEFHIYLLTHVITELFTISGKWKGLKLVFLRKSFKLHYSLH